MDLFIEDAMMETTSTVNGTNVYKREERWNSRTKSKYER